ncbi:MAG TPA: hypothetical protein PLO69_14625 [Gammaproteobacteria bacterium]|nr:hypothetical protein [Gammaproteobacteria bacterium]
MDDVHVAGGAIDRVANAISEKSAAGAATAPKATASKTIASVVIAPKIAASGVAKKVAA